MGHINRMVLILSVPYVKLDMALIIMTYTYGHMKGLVTIYVRGDTRVG